MKNLIIEKDIRLLCKTVDPFPSDIKNSFDTLQSKIPDCESRLFYGLAWKMDTFENLLYKAAAERLEGEDDYGFESFILPAGDYICETVIHWPGNEHLIGEAFTRLLENPDTDPKAPGIEIYREDDSVDCLIQKRPVQ